MNTDAFIAARRAYVAAVEARNAWVEEQVKLKYSELRARDKAQGKDVSGKSVSGRRTLAYDLVVMSPEGQASREAVEALHVAYQEAQGG